jgi:hypothetical protein
VSTGLTDDDDDDDDFEAEVTTVAGVVNATSLLMNASKSLFSLKMKYIHVHVLYF